MPPSAPAPPPRSSRISIVSAWSPAWCPKARKPAPCARMQSSKKAYRIWRAAASVEQPFSLAKAATSPEDIWQGMPRAAQKAATKAASARLASPRSPCSKCAAHKEKPCSSFNCNRASKSAIESGPPDTPHTTADNRDTPADTRALRAADNTLDIFGFPIWSDIPIVSVLIPSFKHPQL